MKKNFWLMFFFFCIWSATLYATNETVDVPISQVLDVNPLNNEIEMVAQVIYPSGCFQPLQTSGYFESEDLIINHKAELRSYLCPQVILPKYPSLKIQKPQIGSYKIWDATTEKYLGKLVVTNNSVRIEGGPL